MARPCRCLREVWRAEQGSALAELALVLPFLLLLIFGMFYFGMLLYANIAVELAASQSARMLAASMVEEYEKDKENYNPQVAVSRAGKYAKEIIKGSLNEANLVKVVPMCRDIEDQNAVQVTVVYRFDLGVPFMSLWGATSEGVLVQRQAVYRVEKVSDDPTKLCP